MDRIDEIGVAVLLWAAWCFLHSLLISRSVTAWMRNLLGRKFGYYRLGYNVFSLASLVPVVYFHLRLEEKTLFAWPWPWPILKYVMYGTALLLFYGGARVYDLRAMLGVKQVKELANGEEPEEMEFTTGGIMGYMRHPWYSGTILLVWAFGNITDVSLAVKVVLTIYLLIGTVLEERKLIAEIGRPYIEYRREVPMLVPWKKLP